MKIKVLDKLAMGADTPLSAFKKYGDLTIYDSTDKSDLKTKISDADIIILNKVKIIKEDLEGNDRLKLICVFATGYDNIDLKAAEEKGIAVCNVPGYSTDSVSLFTFSTVLALISKLFEYRKFVATGEYSRSSSANKLEPVYHDLGNKVWGIIGLGNIGRKVAKIAEAFGAEVIAYTRTPNNSYKTVALDELCKRSDIITIHCPLNEKTRNLINKHNIELMKDNVVLVNEARGAVVSEKDVADAVISGKISAFGSDVYSEEPFGEEHPFYRIKDFDNVILTPHSAWASFESRSKCVDIICKNIEAYLNGDFYNRVDI